jgi:hypothetical protein
MNKINLEFFDFFGAIIPGIPVFVISCFITSNTPFSFIDTETFIKESSLTILTVIFLVSYGIGFCLHYPAYETFQMIMKLWGRKRTLGLPISIGKRESDLVVIREKCPENFKLISKFLALRQMSYTMFFSLLVFFILLLISSIVYQKFDRDFYMTIIFSLTFGFLFLRRSVAFHQRIQEMINECLKII